MEGPCEKKTAFAGNPSLYHLFLGQGSKMVCRTRCRRWGVETGFVRYTPMILSQNRTFITCMASDGNQTWQWAGSIYDFRIQGRGSGVEVTVLNSRVEDVELPGKVETRS